MSQVPPSEMARSRQVFALLAEVCELDPEARELALAACSDPEVVREVRRKLAAPQNLAELLTEQLYVPEVVDTARRSVQLGDAVGPFVIRELLGEGGMGQVFRAVQNEPVRREVALKVVRLGHLQTEAQIRFEAERQAMARLDHPNIGRILEAGMTDDGLPFFAMELIDGPPITTYCDERALSIEQRLRLFVEVCRGTHHAHLKLLLHRDLKPSNVLVAEVDGRPVPKIIDFGIAKGLGAPLVTRMAPTRHGFVGTPSYMSPEALDSARELDARSDVFSLGILLYELLTGSLPWEVPDQDPMQLVKKRLERDAEAPSTQVSGLDSDRRERIARERRLDSDHLAKRLRGDLDSLVMKAIEPEPGRRYDSAAELADDVERHLASEPIHARPLTTSVLVGKLLRRHRGPVLAAATVLVALVIGSIGTAVGLLRAQQAEREAVAKARAAEEARDEADEVADFLVGIVAAADPWALEADKPPGEVTALEILARGAERIETDLADRPLVRGRLEVMIGFLYLNLGEFERSRKLLRASLRTLEATDSPPPELLARSHVNLAYTELQFAERAEATRHLDAVLALVETLPDEEALPFRARAFDITGQVRQGDGDLVGAEEAYREAIAAYTALGDDSLGALANAHNTLNSVYSMQGRYVDAEAQARRAIEITESLVGADHPRIAGYTMSLAGNLANQGRLEEAAVLFEKVERSVRKRYGDDHYLLGTVIHNLGVLNRDLERYDRSEEFFREAVAILERTLGSEHPRVGVGLNGLARAVSELGRDAEARQLQERALAICESALGTDHPWIADSLDHLATLAIRRGEHELAHRHARRAYDIRVSQLDPGARDLGLAAALLGETLWHLDHHDEARQRFDEARRIFVADRESDHESRADDLEDLDERLARLGVSS